MTEIIFCCRHREFGEQTYVTKITCFGRQTKFAGVLTSVMIQTTANTSDKGNLSQLVGFHAFF